MKTNELESKEKNALSYELAFSPEEIRMNHTIFGTTIEVDECNVEGRIGQPAMPVKMVRIALPPGTDLKGFSIGSIKQSVLSKNKTFIAPIQLAEVGVKDNHKDPGLSAFNEEQLKQIPPLKINKEFYQSTKRKEFNQKRVKFNTDVYLPDENAYEKFLSTEFSPVKLVRVEDFGGYKVALFKVRPVQWKKDLTLSLNTSIQITIQYELVRQRSKSYRKEETNFVDINRVNSVTDTNFTINQYASPISAVRANDLNQTLVINPELIPDYRPYWPIFYGPAEYLIITDNNTWNAQTITPIMPINGDQVAEYRKIILWKKLKGMTARLVTITDIVNGVYGDYRSGSRDLQEVIRKFLKWAHAEWGVSWLLLGGDISIVPARNIAGNLCGEFTAVNDIKPDAGKMKREANFVKLNVTGWGIMTTTTLLDHQQGQAIPYDAVGNAATGWYFTTNDNYNVRSVAPTNFVRVNGNNTTVNARLRWLRNENIIPTDYYYSNLTAPSFTHDWDANNNSLYGQAVGAADIDGVNAMTDISVGRIPSDNALDAATFVKKLMAYEQLRNPDTNAPMDTTWLKKIMYLSANWGGVIDIYPKPVNVAIANNQYEYKSAINRTVIQTENPLSSNDWRLLSALAGDTFSEINYTPLAATTNATGWYFANNGNFTQASEFLFEIPLFGIVFRFPIPTRWIAVKSSSAIMQPSRFVLNNYGVDGSLADQEQLRNQIQANFSHYSMVERLYEDERDMTPAQIAGSPLQHLTEARLVNKINEGQHIISMSGHGWWGGCCGFSPNIGQNATNGYNTFIGYADSCLTNEFDQPDAISEILLKNPNGGAIAYIGSTRYSWIGVGDNFQRAFFNRLRTTRHLGLALDVKATMLNENTGFWSDYNNWTIFCLNLMGDPEMEVWRSEPGLLKLKYARPMYGATFMKVNVTDLNTRLNLRNVVVSVVQNNSIIRQAKTDVNGNVSLKISGTRGIDFELVAVLPDYRPEFRHVVYGPKFIHFEDVKVNNLHFDGQGVNSVEVSRLDQHGAVLVEKIQLPASIEEQNVLIDSLELARELKSPVNLTLDAKSNLLAEVQLQ